MANVAVVFSSNEGQTRTIAEHMKRRLVDHGDTVALYQVSKQAPGRPLAGEFDTVIVGGPVYAGKYPKTLVRWAKNQQPFLQTKKTAFFSVSLSAADSRPEARKADDELLKSFLTATGLHPAYVASIAGALKYREYGWLKRWIMKRNSRSAGGPTDTTRDYEMTDWSQVDLFVDSVSGRQADNRFITDDRLKGVA
jgi:menaquinone-dependent protoporphyrinogen oxidase